MLCVISIIALISKLSGLICRAKFIDCIKIIKNFPFCLVTYQEVHTMSYIL